MVALINPKSSRRATVPLLSLSGIGGSHRAQLGIGKETGSLINGTDALLASQYYNWHWAWSDEGHCSHYAPLLIPTPLICLRLLSSISSSLLKKCFATSRSHSDLISMTCLMKFFDVSTSSK